jgi:hypothetical protein
MADTNPPSALAQLDTAEADAVHEADLKAAGGEIVVREKGGAPAIAEPIFDPYWGASTLRLSDAQCQELIRPFETLEHEIKPTGEIYVPQVLVRLRLSKVFGPAGWALIPDANPKPQPSDPGRPITVIQKFSLRAQGVFIAQAWGEGDYHPKNQQQSLASAAEACKSNALTRCAKDLSVGWECWDKTFQQKFRNEHCVKVRAWKYGKSEAGFEFYWRRKDRDPLPGEQQEAGATPPKH